MHITTWQIKLFFQLLLKCLLIQALKIAFAYTIHIPLYTPKDLSHWAGKANSMKIHLHKFEFYIPMQQNTLLFAAASSQHVQGSPYSCRN